jgi:hypothetical protein
MKTTNDDCVHTWGSKKNGRAGTNISKVSQPPAWHRISAAWRPEILVCHNGHRHKHNMSHVRDNRWNMTYNR